MQQSFYAMSLALRVLTAITESRQPDPADLEALQQYVGPPPEGIGVDEFACSVIQKALTERARARAAGRVST